VNCHRTMLGLNAAKPSPSLWRRANHSQNEAKKAGLPWSAAKGYDTFTPVGRFLPVEAVPRPQNVRLWLKVSARSELHQAPARLTHICTVHHALH